MRFHTKIAVFILAVFLTLVGVNLIASGIETQAFINAHGSGTRITVEVSNVRVLA
jgi:hypothetical protein